MAGLCVFMVSIVLNGNAFKLWSLHRDFERISEEILTTKSTIKSLSGQLKQAKDPSYIERQARDKLDLVGEHDLVFVFSDQ
ncbi:Septum formation initiator [compost metagenome]